MTALARPRLGPGLAWRRRASYAQDAALVVAAAAFFWVHGQKVLDGDVTSLPIAIEQALLCGLFLFRRRSRYTSSRVGDWVVATIGTWGTLALRPLAVAPGQAAFAGTALQSAGVLIAAFALLNLGRSIGVVAANRGLKTRGPYAVVRHPAYAGHILTTTGFTLAHPHAWNIGVGAMVIAGLLLRIRAEERVLEETDDYATYRAQVRWRLCPGIY